MERSEECQFIRLLTDGTLIVNKNEVNYEVEIEGIEIPATLLSAYMEFFTQHLAHFNKPLQCFVQSILTPSRIRAKLLYFGWQDKSGDVWLDLAITLLDEGLVRVASYPFANREEYLFHQQNATSN